MEVGHPLGRRRRRRRTCQPPPPHLGMAKVNDAEGLDKAEEDRIGGSVGSVGSGRRGPRTSTSSTNHNPTSSSLCRADSHRGFAVTCMNLRPATHVKVGYPLLCYLNRKACWTALFPTFSASGDDDDDDNIGSCNRLPARKEELRFDDADGILNDVYGTWVRGCCQTATKGADEDEAEDETNTLRVDEMALTKALADQMQYALRHNDDGANLKVRSEFHVQMTNPDRTGTVDVLVQDREESPVLLVEVGLRNEDWWKKLDQGLMCVPALKEFHKPFLFVVLTMDVKRDDDPDNIQGGRMGAYLITPRSQGDNANPRRHLAKFRMTLLWRDETRDLNQFSKHFGRILRAACLLPTWNVAPSTYKYLGPSCCRIGKNKKDWKVLRVYDNRLLHTDRRPDLYLDKELGEGGEIVCQISDTAPPEDALAFGARIEVDSRSSISDGTGKVISSSSRDWLWAKKGQFVAIVVPYRHGRHYATNIKDFKPILRHLRRLHELGFVHGDVRGFNMAMKDANDGFLIDLDYGGKVTGDVGNPPRYPEGYNFGLADGARPKRPDRNLITMKDDLEAMTNLMFGLYKPVPDDYRGSADSYFSLTRQQTDLVTRVAKLEVGSVEAVLLFHESLLQFADEAGWSVIPATVVLRDALEHFGYDLEIPPDQTVQGHVGADPARVGTDPATGSPSKVQKG